MKNRGFTLVEVLISIFLLGIIAVTILPMFSQGFKAVFSSKSKTNAINVARKDLIYDLNNSTSVPTTTIYFANFSDGSSDQPIDVSSYLIEKNYKLPNMKSESTLNLRYYSYTDSY